MTGGVGSNSTTRPKSSMKARLRLWGCTAVHTHRPCKASGRARPLQDHPSRPLAGKALRVPRPGWECLFYPLLPGQGWSCSSAGATLTPGVHLGLGSTGGWESTPFSPPPGYPGQDWSWALCGPSRSRRADRCPLPCLLGRHPLRAILSNLSLKSQSDSSARQSTQAHPVGQQPGGATQGEASAPGRPARGDPGPAQPVPWAPALGTRSPRAPELGRRLSPPCPCGRWRPGAGGAPVKCGHQLDKRPWPRGQYRMQVPVLAGGAAPCPARHPHEGTAAGRSHPPLGTLGCGHMWTTHHPAPPTPSL